MDAGSSDRGALVRGSGAGLTPWQRAVLERFAAQEQQYAGRWYRRKEIAGWVGRKRLLPYHVEMLARLVQMGWLEMQRRDSPVAVVQVVTWYRLHRARLGGSTPSIFLWE